MRRLLPVLFFVAGLAGCSHEAAKEPESPPSTPAPPVTRTDVVIARPEKTVRKFLDWYVKNQASLPGNFIDHADGRDTTQQYAVNFAATEKWLAAVGRSEVVSPAYLQHWRAYFKQWGDTLRVHPQHDGPPAGFEYDFLLLSQEPEEKVAELQAGTFVTKQLANSQVMVTALGPKHEGWREGMHFKLAQAPSGQWLIDEMSVPDNLTQ